MDAPLSFTVHGQPVPQPRIRATRSGHVYTPGGKIQPYKQAIGLLAKAEARRIGWQMTDGPVEVSIECVFSRPRSHTTAAGAVRPAAPVFPGRQAGDVDNLEKAVLDAVTRAGAVWQDDSQVVDCRVRKRWAGPGEASRLMVTVRRV